ncbi:MAG: MSHA pilin protein MshA [Oleispira sp.]|jgi:MSHA pilin protein MshA
MKQFNKQAGFTLIELIMVIVILGVLSAFALPRFADLGGNARTASINGLAGTLRAASNIAHAQLLASGSSSTTNAELEGASVTMIASYPTADADGIGKAAQVSATATGAGADYAFSGGGTGVGAVITYSIPGASGTCQVTYTAADDTGATTVTPVVAVSVGGC